jgi:hypothetical protein
MRQVFKTIIISSVASIFILASADFLVEKLLIIYKVVPLTGVIIIRVFLIIGSLLFLKRKLKSRINYQISFFTSFGVSLITSIGFDLIFELQEGTYLFRYFLRSVGNTIPYFLICLIVSLFFRSPNYQSSIDERETILDVNLDSK